MKLWTVGELNVYLKDKLENDHVDVYKRQDKGSV